MWRGALARGQAEVMRDRVGAAPIARVDPADLAVRAWSMADRFGWAKTYDANYVALAQLLECRVVTLDGRLRRGADRSGLIVGPDEL
jgi:predicted nucleic acid-binding protein